MNTSTAKYAAKHNGKDLPTYIYMNYAEDGGLLCRTHSRKLYLYKVQHPVRLVVHDSAGHGLPRV